MKDSIDIVFSLDTTGSMSTCIGQVRKNIIKTVDLLFDNIPSLRIGIIAHGDYCDGKNSILVLDLTNDNDKVINFVKKAPDTDGGDFDENYEQVLYLTRSLSWTSGINKALVVIGDSNPHEVGYRYNNFVNSLDWRNELGLLVESGINVYPVQCLNRDESNRFYNEIANVSNTPKLTLNQFSDINDLILSLCFKRANQIEKLEKIISSTKVNFNKQFLDTLSGVKVNFAKVDKDAVNPSRFQVFVVDKDMPIKEFVEENGLRFEKGKGFYEFTKSVLIQDYKEVVAINKNTGDMFSGNLARKKAGIPVGKTAKVKPDEIKDYRFFVQSTSLNRKLIAGTRFMYEVDDVY